MDDKMKRALLLGFPLLGERQPAPIAPDDAELAAKFLEEVGYAPPVAPVAPVARVSASPLSASRTCCPRCHLPLHACPGPDYHPPTAGDFVSHIREESGHMVQCLDRLSQGEIEALGLRDMSNYRRDVIYKYAQDRYRTGVWTQPARRDPRGTPPHGGRGGRT